MSILRFFTVNDNTKNNVKGNNNHSIYTMSQSDYIRYKRVNNEMAEMSKFPRKMPSILESGKYISYKEYSLENTIVNHTEEYDKLVKPNYPIVFGMVKKCIVPEQNMIMCRDTNQRPNRILVTNTPMFTKPKVNDIPKQKRMNWNTILDNKMCKCVNV